MCLCPVILYIYNISIFLSLWELLHVLAVSICKIIIVFFQPQRKHFSYDCTIFEYILSIICCFQLLLYVLLNCSNSEKEFENNCLFLQLLPADNCAHNIHGKGQPIATEWLKFPLCFCFAVAATHLIRGRDCWRLP